MTEPSVYTITNTVNGKMYVGYSNKPKGRKIEHWWELKNNIHKNDRLQKAWNKYGEQSFTFEILDTYEEKYLPSMEHYWCNLLQSHNRKYGYNLRPTHPENRHCIAEETRKKITAKLIGRKWSAETREKHKNYKHSEDTRKKLAAKKIPCKEETKKKISEAIQKVAIQWAKEGKKWGTGTLMLDENGNYVKKHVKKNLTKEEFSKIISEARYKSEKIKRKPVIAYNVDDGTEYMKFRSIADAAKYMNKKSPSKLTKAIKQEKALYNKIWKYES